MGGGGAHPRREIASSPPTKRNTENQTRGAENEVVDAHTSLTVSRPPEAGAVAFVSSARERLRAHLTQCTRAFIAMVPGRLHIALQPHKSGFSVTVRRTTRSSTCAPHAAGGQGSKKALEARARRWGEYKTDRPAARMTTHLGRRAENGRRERQMGEERDAPSCAKSSALRVKRGPRGFPRRAPRGGLASLKFEHELQLLLGPRASDRTVGSLYRFTRYAAPRTVN